MSKMRGPGLIPAVPILDSSLGPAGDPCAANPYRPLSGCKEHWPETLSTEPLLAHCSVSIHAAAPLFSSTILGVMQ